ncbi:DnaJ-domain-containing protein [Basidiobolus meristosporus CBS 931.73]|uniref:DnaJ-domain-containing protein n=1 Tax=Basidiobolus meristosporus CBS 931.73 TaxID=1314790 RepID=A0A1Y1XT53_9FUNG|nr:DnaJ-domain-containing protein [Basidiobolus meristosporus CBS 931.73]|eukprot:ORX88484.1 DnaJ-domain-containing protein [Basidiobolus meristosporus CBS 931.73]
MEVNKDEASRCLDIAKKHFDGGNRASALKFARKSIALYPTTEAEKFLLKVEQSSDEPSSPPPAYEAAAGPKTSIPNNPKAESTSGRQTKAYTKEQVEAVKKIKACNPNDFYAILGIEKSATEAQIKKAYRKLALQFHPDKNSAPGADEAFKLISKAFTILSDSDKRRVFDQSGCDPESRSSGARGFSSNTRGYQFEDEINPEQLFNMFFGGGFPASTFMGHDGVRYHRQYQRPQYAHRGAASDSDTFTYLKLLPFFLLFLFSILSSLFSGTPDPDFSFDLTGHFNHRRETRKRHVEYFVEPREFHSVFSNTAYNSKLRQFEENVESQYYRYLVYECNQERQRKDEAIRQAKSWIFPTDKKKLEKAQNMRLPYCEKAQAFK